MGTAGAVPVAGSGKQKYKQNTNRNSNIQTAIVKAGKGKKGKVLGGVGETLYTLMGLPMCVVRWLATCKLVKWREILFNFNFEL